MSRDDDQKRNESPYMEMSGDKDEYISNEIKLKNHSLTFIHKNKWLHSATSILSHWPMA